MDGLHLRPLTAVPTWTSPRRALSQEDPTKMDPKELLAYQEEARLYALSQNVEAEHEHLAESNDVF